MMRGYVQSECLCIIWLTMSLTISSVDLPATGTPFTSSSSSPSRRTSAHRKTHMREVRGISGYAVNITAKVLELLTYH